MRQHLDIRIAGVNRRLVIDIVGLVLGVVLRLTLDSNRAFPLTEMQNSHLAASLYRLMFNAVTYLIVAGLFMLRIVQLKFVGFWSFVLSIVVGGLLASVALSIR